MKRFAFLRKRGAELAQTHFFRRNEMCTHFTRTQRVEASLTTAVFPAALQALSFRTKLVPGIIHDFKKNQTLETKNLSPI